MRAGEFAGANASSPRGTAAAADDPLLTGVLVLWPEHSYREDGNGISLPDAVMSLDVGRLLLRGTALA